MYEKVAPVLIKSFAEREEIVRLDVIVAFGDLVAALSQAGCESPSLKRRGNDDIQIDQESPLAADIHAIVSILSKQFTEKSISTVSAGFNLLTNIVKVLAGGLDESLSLLLPYIKAALTIEKTHSQSSNTTIKIQVLNFLAVVLKQHHTAVLDPYFPAIVSSLIESTYDAFYKVRSESIFVIGLVIENIYSTDENENLVEVVRNLYEATWNLLQESEMETEVTETAINTLSMTIANAGNVLDKDQILNQLFPQLLAQLSVETTRTSTIKAIKAISTAPVFDAPVWPPFVNEIRRFITKSHRPTAVESISCLKSLVTKCPLHIKVNAYIQILEDLDTIFSHAADLHILPLSFDLLETVIESAIQYKEVVEILETQTIPKLLKIMADHHHVFAEGASLRSLLDLWNTIMRFDTVLDAFHFGIMRLLEPKSKDVYSIN